MHDERAMVERLARFMGWTKSKPPRGAHPWHRTDDLLWWIEGGAPVASVAEWNPLTDANADVQVLERAREVWASAYEGENAREPWARFRAGLPDASWYEVGMFSRAVDAVLLSSPDSGTGEGA